MALELEDLGGAQAKLLLHQHGGPEQGVAVGAQARGEEQADREDQRDGVAHGHGHLPACHNLVGPVQLALELMKKYSNAAKHLANSVLVIALWAFHSAMRSSHSMGSVGRKSLATSQSAKPRAARR